MWSYFWNFRLRGRWLTGCTSGNSCDITCDMIHNISCSAIKVCSKRIRIIASDSWCYCSACLSSLSLLFVPISCWFLELVTSHFLLIDKTCAYFSRILVMLNETIVCFPVRYLGYLIQIFEICVYRSIASNFSQKFPAFCRIWYDMSLV